MVYGDVATLSDIFESDGSAYACGSTGYCGSFGEEEVVWHFRFCF